MIRIDILSGVPDLLKSPLEHSIVGRAVRSGLADIRVHDLHDHSASKHRKIDDAPYGGGAGMVLTPQPIFDCVDTLLADGPPADQVIYTSPAGRPFRQPDAVELSLCRRLIFLCGHYKGVDQRVRDALVTREYSVGDVVLSGGELPVLMMVDALVRLLPGAIGDVDSAMTDSFQEDALLEGPIYTRPAVFRGMQVPDILRSGDHERIERWRREQSEELTRTLRPDLYRNLNSTTQPSQRNTPDEQT